MPGDMRGAQESALIALEWRRDGLDRIAQQIRPALGDEGEQADAAIEQIAGQMAGLPRVRRGVGDARDPVHQERARRGGDRRPGDQPLAVPAGPRLARARRRSPTVLDQQLTSGGDGGGEPTGPGLHGSGLDSTNYGDVDAPARRQRTGSRTSPAPAFTVNFTNQGENDEFDIKVTLRIQREGGDPITTSTTIPKVGGRRERDGRAAARGPAAARHRGDDPRQRRARAGRGEGRQQPVRVPRAVHARLTAARS